MGLNVCHLRHEQVARSLKSSVGPVEVLCNLPYWTSGNRLVSQIP